MKTVLKWLAKVLIQYLPDVAVWAVKLASDKTSESETAQRVLDVVEQVSKDANALATIMKDGKVTDVEVEQVRMRVTVLVDDLEALL